MHFSDEMSFDWTSQPLSIQAIASQYTLPVAIRSAPGFRGSSRPIILHSISRVTFAFGRALKTSPTSTKNEDGTYRSIDSEIIAIPLKYPGKQTRKFLLLTHSSFSRIFRMFTSEELWYVYR